MLWSNEYFIDQLSFLYRESIIPTRETYILIRKEYLHSNYRKEIINYKEDFSILVPVDSGI